jgi:hypothetical protein
MSRSRVVGELIKVGRAGKTRNSRIGTCEPQFQAKKGAEEVPGVPPGGMKPSIILKGLGHEIALRS